MNEGERLSRTFFMTSANHSTTLVIGDVVTYNQQSIKYFIYSWCLGTRGFANHHREQKVIFFFVKSGRLSSSFEPTHNQ